MLEVVLVQCILVDNQYQQKSEVLHSFALNESYGSLLNVKPNYLVFLKTYNTEFDDITITSTDEKGRLSEIEDKVNLTLLINKKIWLVIPYKTKNKKVCERILIFVIWEKFV